MRIIGDLHCHTIASVHAYNTIYEMAARAGRLGYRVLAVTDHGIAVPASAPLEYFNNLVALPRKVKGVHLLRGCEANIVDFQGTIDMPEATLGMLDVVIASLHLNCCAPGAAEDHTAAYLAVAKNPIVNIIGHCETSCYPFDMERVLEAFKRTGKVVELNTHSFICRRDSLENLKRVMALCRDMECPILINSDAHVASEMGQMKEAGELLRELKFPQRLIINSSRKNMNRYLERIGVDVII